MAQSEILNMPACSVPPLLGAQEEAVTFDINAYNKAQLERARALTEKALLFQDGGDNCSIHAALAVKLAMDPATPQSEIDRFRSIAPVRKLSQATRLHDALLSRISDNIDTDEGAVAYNKIVRKGMKFQAGTALVPALSRIGELADAVDKGFTPILGIHFGNIWEYISKEPFRQEHDEHVVMVAGVQRDGYGKVSHFILNDSGMGAVYPIAAAYIHAAITWPNTSSVVIPTTRAAALFGNRFHTIRYIPTRAAFGSGSDNSLICLMHEWSTLKAVVLRATPHENMDVRPEGAALFRVRSPADGWLNPHFEACRASFTSPECPNIQYPEYAYNMQMDAGNNVIRSSGTTTITYYGRKSANACQEITRKSHLKELYGKYLVLNEEIECEKPEPPQAQFVEGALLFQPAYCSDAREMKHLASKNMIRLFEDQTIASPYGCRGLRLPF